MRAVRAVLGDPQRYRAVYDNPDSPLPTWTWEAQAAVLDAIYRSLLSDAPSPQDRERSPDVSVVVPVYNTMPYLTGA